MAPTPSSKTSTPKTKVIRAAQSAGTAPARAAKAPQSPRAQRNRRPVENRKGTNVLASGKVASSPSSPSSTAAGTSVLEASGAAGGCLRAAPGGSGRALALRCARRSRVSAGDGQTDATGGGSELRIAATTVSVPEPATSAPPLPTTSRRTTHKRVLPSAQDCTIVAVPPPMVLETTEAPSRSEAHLNRRAEEGTTMNNLLVDPTVRRALTTKPTPTPTTKRAIQGKRGKHKKTMTPRPVDDALAQLSVSTQEPEDRSRKPRTSQVALATNLPPTPVERYVGLDIGKRTEFCEVKQEQVTQRATVDNEQQLEKLLGPGTAKALVVFEACREGWYLYDLLTGWGHEVWMVDTTRVRQLGIGQHKRKNDRIDAEVLARAGESGRVPKAHVLSHDAQRWRMELGVRRALVETRAQYVTTIRSILRSEGLSVPSCETRVFLKKLKGVELPPAVGELIEPLVVALQAIGPQIDKVDAQLEIHSSAQPVVRLLSSVPGVGRIVAAAFISVIDDPGRFRTAHQVEAYLGLVPSESTSGKRKLGAITKQGNGYLRAMLTQAAWQVQRQRRSDPLKSWGQAVSKRRGKRVGVIAVARRLAGILWAIWRHNRPYDPSLLGQASARGKRQEAHQTTATACAIGQASDATRRA